MSRFKSSLAILVALIIAISCSVPINRAEASDGVVDFVTRCYEKILGRKPDSGGLKSWSEQLRAGTKTAAEIINGFMNSTEFQKKYLSDTETIEILYNTMLDRKSDEGGMKYWLGYLRAGNPIGVVINGFCNSTEFRKLCSSYGIKPGSVQTGTVKPPVEVKEVPKEDPNKVEKIRAFVTRCYRVILGREPEAAGLNDWTNQLKAGKKCAAEIIEGFVSSNEFRNKHLSDSDCVEILYKAMLDRASDAGGKKHWLSYLNGGNSLSVVIDGFCRSTEFTKLCNTYGIKPGSINVGEIKPPVAVLDDSQMNKIREFVTRCYKVILGRNPDTGGLNDWTNQLAKGKKTASEIINGFMTSNELKNKKLGMGDTVELLYQAMLGRSSDANGKKYWMSVLNGGNEIGVVINGFCNSNEFKKLCESYGIKPGSVATGPVKPSVPVNESGTEVRKEVTQYEIIYQNDYNRYPEDGNIIIQAGQTGLSNITYSYDLNMKGERVNYKKISEEVVKKPVNAIISIPCKAHSEGTREETETETVPYDTEYQYDSTRPKGNPDKIIRQGKNGVKTNVYTITYKDDTVFSKVLKSSKITTQPVSMIISIANGQNVEATTPPSVVETKQVTSTEVIPFNTVYQNDPNRTAGEADIVLQEGVNGKKTLVHLVTYTDGVVTAKELISETITKQPVDKIVSVATGEYTISYETETITIPFETTVIDTENMNAGETYVEVEGIDGQKEVTYAIKKDKNGNIVSWDICSETVIREVVNQVMYRGTFVPSITYTYVYVPNLPECDPNLRDTNIDEECALWAMEMAVCGTVKHSGQGHAESVGGWGSIDEVVYGREYTEINPDNGQVYSGNTSLGSHGGEGLANGHRWGAGCVARTTTLPGGGTNTVYYACARSEVD